MVRSFPMPAANFAFWKWTRPNSTEFFGSKWAEGFSCLPFGALEIWPWQAKAEGASFFFGTLEKNWPGEDAEKNWPTYFSNGVETTNWLFNFMDQKYRLVVQGSKFFASQDGARNQQKSHREIVGFLGHVCWASWCCRLEKELQCLWDLVLYFCLSWVWGDYGCHSRVRLEKFNVGARGKFIESR